MKSAGAAGFARPTVRDCRRAQGYVLQKPESVTLLAESIELDFEPPDFAVQQIGRAVLGHSRDLAAALASTQGFGQALYLSLPLPD